MWLVCSAFLAWLVAAESLSILGAVAAAALLLGATIARPRRGLGGLAMVPAMGFWAMGFLGSLIYPTVAPDATVSFRFERVAELSDHGTSLFYLASLAYATGWWLATRLLRADDESVLTNQVGELAFLRSTGLSNWVGSGGLGEEPVESYGGCLEVQGGSGPLVEGVGDGA